MKATVVQCDHCGTIVHNKLLRMNVEDDVGGIYEVAYLCPQCVTNVLAYFQQPPCNKEKGEQ